MNISRKYYSVFKKFKIILLAISLFIIPILSVDSQVTGVEYAVLIGVDGMSPDGVDKANTPIMDDLIKQCAYSMSARAVMPSSSSPNWSSMIMGAGPEQHGITSNAWRPDKFQLPPTDIGIGGIFPTIFSLLREQQPSAVTACFHDWGGITHLIEHNAVSIIEDTDGPVHTTERAVSYFKEKKPIFTFIHLDHVDHAGHAHGYMSPEYYKSVEEADRLIGEIINGLKTAGMHDKTIIIITSDHGGVGKGHGGASQAEIFIPWIITGPGVVQGKELKSFINIYDTASTIAYVLGIKTPKSWIAKPVLESFESK
ncbi:alkaline phosphatase [Candidatus Poribacteria bacterium]|nr:alkaline phosphatase [Candidatus Poribacteria bacterium]